MPFEKKKSVVESVHKDESFVGTLTPEKNVAEADRRDSVRIGDIVVWRAPSSDLTDPPAPGLVIKVGGRRTLSLYVFTDSGTRIIRGARHWTDPDFDSPHIDTTMLSSWSFKDE